MHLSAGNQGILRQINDTDGTTRLCHRDQLGTTEMVRLSTGKAVYCTYARTGPECPDSPSHASSSDRAGPFRDQDSCGGGDIHGGDVPDPSGFSALEDFGYELVECLIDMIDGSGLGSDVSHNPPQSSGISTAASGPRDDIFAHMINFVGSHFKGVFEARGLASQPT